MHKVLNYYTFFFVWVTKSWSNAQILSSMFLKYTCVWCFCICLHAVTTQTKIKNISIPPESHAGSFSIKHSQIHCSVCHHILVLLACDVCVCVCVLVTQSCLTLCDPHGLKLTRLLCPWNSLGKNTGCAIPFSRGFSWPRDQNQVSHIAGRFFTIWVTREALCQYKWSRTVCIIFPCLLLKIFFPVIYKLCHSGPILFYSFSYNFIGL